MKSLRVATVLAIFALAAPAARPAASSGPSVSKLKSALAKAQKTLRNLRWFHIVETRGDIKDGQVNHWQVTIKVGFTLED